MSNLDRFAGVAIADPQDKPLDWVADCGEIFCGKPIHFGDRCILDENGDHFCNESCFIAANGAKPVRAGTEEFTI